MMVLVYLSARCVLTPKHQTFFFFLNAKICFSVKDQWVQSHEFPFISMPQRLVKIIHCWSTGKIQFLILLYRQTFYRPFRFYFYLPLVNQKCHSGSSRPHSRRCFSSSHPSDGAILSLESAQTFLLLKTSTRLLW